MALNDITLTAGMRSNLVNLQETVTLLNRTQTRLASGKKVNTALDNPISFFTAQSHMSRASGIAALKDGMNESVQTIKAADSGIKGGILIIFTSNCFLRPVSPVQIKYSHASEADRSQQDLLGLVCSKLLSNKYSPI